MDNKLIIALIALSLWGGIGYGELYQEHKSDKITRATAIDHGCGQYNPQSGIFEWQYVQLPPVDASILDHMPLPQEKPKVPNVKHH